MKTLVLNAPEVSKLLPIKECIGVMREALIALAAGKVHQPLRTIIRPPNAKGVMGLMPSYMSGEGAAMGRRQKAKSRRQSAEIESGESAAGDGPNGERAAFGLKAICVFPGNPAKGKDSHQGAVLLFSAETGELLAMMSASAITAIRTAAVSGVATDLLARADACNLAIVGSGVQARSHLAAMAQVRSLKHCRIASRHFEHAQSFAEEMRHEFTFALEPVETVEEAIKDSDLVVTATTSVEPVVRREWIAAGAHLNLVGSSTPKAREVDSETMAAVSLFVDRRESTVNEAGDYLFAVRDGAIGPEHIRAEIGEVLTGDKPGRTSAEEITLFKSLGLAIEDLFAAAYLHKKASEKAVGTWVEF